MATFTSLKGLLGLGVLWAIYTIASAYFSKFRNIPGPLAARFTKLWYFRRVSKGNFQHENIALRRKYGPLVRTGPTDVSVDDPGAVKTIYGIGSKFPKSDWYQSFGVPGSKGANMFNDQDMQRHSENRKQFQHVYSLSTMISYETFADECLDLLATRLDEIAKRGRPVDLAHWFQAYAFDVVASITFGHRLGFLDSGEDIRNMMHHLHETTRYSALVGIFPALHPWLFYSSASLGVWGTKGQVDLMNLVSRHIAGREEERKLRGPEAKLEAQAAGRTPDLMDKIWDRHAEHPDKTTKWHIFSVGVANVTARSDTTGSAISGILYHLLTYPRVLAKLKDEIRRGR